MEGIGFEYLRAKHLMERTFSVSLKDIINLEFVTEMTTVNEILLNGI